MARAFVTCLVAALVFSPASITQAADAAMCGELPCRTNGTPYVSESGGIVIMPGEAFTVDLTIEGDSITAVKPRAANANATNAIDLTFSSSGSGLMLKLMSRVDRTIKVDMLMKLADGRLLPTSSCPIMPRLGVFEMWQDRIEFLELRNFRILKDGATMSCS